MNKTSIPYADLSWNIVTGCTPAGEGCQNCWAARLAATRLKHLPRYKGLAQKCPGGYEWTGEVRFHEDLLDQPRRLRANLHHHQIFVAPMGDLFHDAITTNQIIAVMERITTCQDQTFLVLTKRPQRVIREREWLADSFSIMPNLLLGYSAWGQKSFDAGWAVMKTMPTVLKWVSLEPLLESVDLGDSLKNGLSWVVVGGESGANARPCDPNWIARIWSQCRTARVPFFFKQWGNNVTPDSWARDDNVLVEIANTREIPCSK